MNGARCRPRARTTSGPLSVKERLRDCGVLNDDGLDREAVAKGAVQWERPRGFRADASTRLSRPTTRSSRHRHHKLERRRCRGAARRQRRRQQSYDLWLVKLSADGEYVQKVYGGSGNEYGMRATTGGGYMIMATTSSEEATSSPGIRGIQKQAA